MIDGRCKGGTNLGSFVVCEEDISLIEWSERN